MMQRQFVLVVVDRDTGEFTVEGPMSDEQPWHDTVADAGKAGRNIQYFVMGDLAPDIAAAEWVSSCGGRRIASGSIVWASQHATHW